MTELPRTVVHVITRLDVGGAQATAVRICALLDRDRFRPVLVAGEDQGSGGSLAADATEAGVEVHHLRSLVSPVRPHRDVQAVRDLRSTFANLGVDVVHTHSSKAGALGRMAARSAGVPAVHTVHGWSFHDGQRPIVRRGYQWIERRLASSTAALVVVTPVDEEIGLADGIGTRSQYNLIRSGIVLPPVPAAEQRLRVRSELGWGADVHGLVAVGRLAPQKDPVALIDAIAFAVAERAQVRLAVVGDGPLRPEVEAAIARHGLADRVQLLGIRHDVAVLLAGADGFVSAARWEGLPRTVLEAVAVGVPVAVTDVGGVRDIIDPGRTGVLVPSEDPPALGRAVVDLVDHPADARSRAEAARLAIDEFDERTMADRTMDLYDRVLGAGR